MSDNTPTTIPPHTPDPRNQPFTLTGMPAVIYTELTCLTDNDSATVAELAASAGIGRSTAGKALVALEKHGLAVRTPSPHDGPRRTPDRWRAAPPASNINNNANGQKPISAQPGPTTTERLKQDATANQQDAPSIDTTPPVRTTADRKIKITSGVATDGTENIASPDPKCGDDNDSGMSHDDGHNHRDNEDGPARLTPRAQHTPSAETHTYPGQKTRLAPGALRQKVLDHLQAHPDEAFTATKISRAIDRSSGAIANALHTLTKQGHAEQVTEQPNTYRAAESGGDA